MPEPLPLTVVVPCSRPAALQACLRGLDAQEAAEPFEVIVVGDTAGVAAGDRRYALTLVACERRHPNVRRNAGIELARGSRVAFLDDDAVPQPGWLRAALSLDPASDTVLAGPETPAATAGFGRLLYEVCRSPLGEGGFGHYHARKMPVSWREVPFCNCVIPRRVLRELGVPSVDIPWDMDDFEFFHRLRGRLSFCNDPDLEVHHDRYPDRLVPWLRYKWRLRVRTGEKLVTHAWLYGKVPAVVAAATLPWALPALVVLAARSSGRARADVALTVAGGYVAAVLLQSLLSLRRLHRTWPAVLADLASFTGLLIALHATTFLGIQAGLARAACGLARAPDETHTTRPRASN